MKTPGLQNLLNCIEEHCLSSAIATFLDSNGIPFVIDLKRQGDRVQYGYQIGMREIFMAKILNGCNPSASLVLRSFTSEIDEITELPIKELRGYILMRSKNDISFEKIPAHTMFACQNTDAKTGEPLPLEQSVRYC
ncbi:MULTISPECIES: hypothetical protein [Spirulina sp. CCY15215]|uniref:hypothetical protein n=1 Tax=Spirulina sp. CCY15215 TaxID=2767591 RepID=UPI001950C990|nr:hypothetical protein [Spirulina major]